MLLKLRIINLPLTLRLTTLLNTLPMEFSALQEYKPSCNGSEERMTTDPLAEMTRRESESNGMKSFGASSEITRDKKWLGNDLANFNQIK